MTTATGNLLATTHQIQSLGRRIMANAREQEQYNQGRRCMTSPRLILAQPERCRDLLELAASLDWEVA